MKIAFTLLAMMFCTKAFAPPVIPAMDAKEIIRIGERQMRGVSTQAVMTMVIHKPGFLRTLTIRSWTMGDSKALVEILQPVKEEGISSLRMADQMWNYLPKSDQIVRVPTSLMLQSWMGSDFTNDDLMKSSSLVRDYNHRVMDVKKIKNQKIIVIECRPKPRAPVVWGKIVYWARANDSLPLKQIYYDDKGRWVRTLEFDNFRKMDDRIIPTLARVRVAEDRRQSTTIVYRRILYDRVLDETLFDKDLLRRTVQAGKNLASAWSEAPLPGHGKPATRQPAKKTMWSSMGFPVSR